MKRHGLCEHPVYKAWESMLARCYNKKHKHYRYYGGRGIRVCRQWKRDFVAFWVDVNSSWQRGLSLDRIDNDGNYEPNNVRWTTQYEQIHNRRNSVLIKTPVGLLRVKDAAALAGVTKRTIHQRHKDGWPVKYILNPPTPREARRNAFGNE